MPRIGLMTSGGECAGLNTALRAVVPRADLGHGWKVIGIEIGTLGLFQKLVENRPLSPNDFDGTLIRQSGTILGSTNTGNPLASESLDGSLALLKKLGDKVGISLICIPKTIDNDVGVTEVAVGYDTAVHVATEALDLLQPTAASHGRVNILKVMGWDAGHILLFFGIVVGADVILILEIPYDIARVARHLETAKERGRRFALIIVVEAVKSLEGGEVTGGNATGTKLLGGIGHTLTARLSKIVTPDIRLTVLGHVQRGGIPTARDGLMTSACGVRAGDLLAEGARNRMAAWRSRAVIDVPIADAISAYHSVDSDGSVVATARDLGISFGYR